MADDIGVAGAGSDAEAGQVGQAADMLLLGAGVDGGLYGEPPSLTDLDEGDLKYTTDFRDVYAMLLADVLGADPGQVLNGRRGRLDVSSSRRR